MSNPDHPVRDAPWDPPWELAGRGSRPALRLPDGTEVTYAELGERVRERAAAWGPARRLVLVEGANDLTSLVSYLAALCGRHVALVVPDGRPDQREAVVTAYDPDIVCTADGTDVRRPRSAHALHPDLALLLSTSGSTGSPKMVRLSRDNLTSNAAAIANYLRIGPDDRAITSLPLHYCYGLSVVHSHLHAGASLVLTDLSVVDPCFWELVTDAGATSFAGVPHTFELLDRSGFADRDLPSLRQVTQAGGRMAPDRVKAYAALAADRGWELVVMYGQTEATARMAYLPSHLALDHPRAIGVAIPGGRLRIDPVADHDEDGVGELVYTGPNVMMGYAHGPGDLARGHELDELRTGDLARRVDGLLEIVGRRSRTAKLFGLRLDLERLEHQLQESGSPATCVATEQRVHAYTTTGGPDPALPERIAALCGVPAGAIRVHPVPHLPMTGSGKVDLAALAAQAAEHDRASDRTAPAGGTDVGAVLAAYALVLGTPDVRPDDTFVGLGGDSLSYVELATRLERLLPHGLPPDWHHLPIRELLPHRATRPPRWRALRRAPRGGVDTTVALRAVAIVLIVASHVDLVAVEGGAHLLLALAGFNFARFQLGRTDRVERLRHGAAGLAQLAVPSVAWIAVVGALTGAYTLATAFFLNGLVGRDRWDDQWQFWFLEALVWVTVAALAVVAVPALHRAEVRHPFAFAAALVALAGVARYLLVGATAGATQRYTPAVVAFFFVLGWWGARARSTRQRLLVSVVGCVLVVDFFGDPAREAVIVTGLLVLLWTSRLPCPRRATALLGTLAGSSLFVYLTHWQVYPPLEDAGHRVLALVASFAVGLAYASLMRPVQRAVGGLVRGAGSARPDGVPAVPPASSVSEGKTATGAATAGR